VDNEIEWDEENQIKSDEHVMENNGDDIKNDIYDPLKIRLINASMEDFAPSHARNIGIKKKEEWIRTWRMWLRNWWRMATSLEIICKR
jgi:hypothetical protein